MKLTIEQITEQYKTGRRDFSDAILSDVDFRDTILEDRAKRTRDLKCPLCSREFDVTYEDYKSHEQGDIFEIKCRRCDEYFNIRWKVINYFEVV